MVTSDTAISHHSASSSAPEPGCRRVRGAGCPGLFFFPGIPTGVTARTPIFGWGAVGDTGTEDQKQGSHIVSSSCEFALCITEVKPSWVYSLKPLRHFRGQFRLQEDWAQVILLRPQLNLKLAMAVCPCGLCKTAPRGSGDAAVTTTFQ